MKMSEDWAKYVNDPRIVCKYGLKCYQKNEDHHAKYKHPPQSLQKHQTFDLKKHRFSPYTRNKVRNSPNTAANDASRSTNAPEISDNNDSDGVEPEPATVEIKRESSENSITKLPQDIQFYDSDTNPQILKDLFLVEMPTDFYKFYEWLNENDNIKQLLSSVNLELIGPYDLLLGKLPIVDDKELYLAHWRFFFDPPEFQAVLKRKDKSEYHIGYFRDDPAEAPVFVGCNDSASDCRITPLAGNIFGAVHAYLQQEKKRSVFSAQPCKKMMDKLTEIANEHNISLTEYNFKQRQSTLVSKTFHGAGIVVPVNKKTELGYRRLAESDASIKKMFAKLQAANNQDEKDKVLSELQPVITFASIAVDEGDYGTGLEVGIDLFCSGLRELESSAQNSLTAAYPLLNREPFSRIIQAHLKYRRKGANMSMLNLGDA